MNMGLMIYYNLLVFCIQ